MKRKSAILFVAATAALATVAVLSCRKSDRTLNAGPGKTPFTVSTARKWYYNVFKKDSSFNYSVKSSFYTRGAAQKKYPIWGFAESKTIGRFEIVELPLVNLNKTVAIPTKGKLMTPEESSKVAQFTKEKVAFFKNSKTGQVKTRIEQFVPDLNYLKAHNYILPANSMTAIAKDFTGWGMIRDWNDRVIAQVRYENGRRKGHLKQVLQSSSRNAHVECVTWQIPIYVRTCLAIPPPSDTPDYDPDVECEKWGETISGYDTEQECFEIEDDPCENLSDEDCLCLGYGICDDGDGGGAVTDPPPPDISECAARTEAEALDIVNGYGDNVEYGGDHAIEDGATYDDAAQPNVKFHDGDISWTMIKTTKFGYTTTVKATHPTLFIKRPGQQWKFYSVDKNYVIGQSGEMVPCTELDVTKVSCSVNLSSDSSLVQIETSYNWQVKSYCSILSKFQFKIYPVTHWPESFKASDCASASWDF